MIMTGNDWRAGLQTHYPAPTQHWSVPSTPSSQGQGRLSMTPTIHKTDINCIAHIVRADMKLRSVLQGEPLHLFRSTLNILEVVF